MLGMCLSGSLVSSVPAALSDNLIFIFSFACIVSNCSPVTLKPASVRGAK